MFKSYLYTTLLTVLILFRSVVAEAATNTALTTGAWETGANWSTGAAPTATDNVIVPAGITMTASVAGDVCGSLTIAATGNVTISANLFIGGNLTNAGTLFTWAGSTLTFNGAATSVISGGGSYTISATVVLNMLTTATVLDVQDANFIGGINAGGKYYFTFTKGTWKMDCASTLGDAYNTGSTNALTIPFGVVIEADNGQMNLAKNGTSNNVLLSGELFLNGGTVYVQTGQAFNSGQDFRYAVNGGRPQLYMTSGTLYVGAGFNAKAATDYIDFHMTGGTMILAQNGYSNSMTFQLADVIGGKTFMSAGLVILQDACNAAVADLDMGGANVAATQYSVTGGTVQLGYVATQAGSTFFGMNAEPATNYPNIDFQGGTAKNVSAFKNGNINMLSLHVNSNMTFDATGFPIVNIMSSNGTFAFDDEGGFIESTNTVTFSGSVPQVISSTTLASESFYNLKISNTSGNVILSVPTVVANKVTFTVGMLDASKFPLTITNGAGATTGASATSYIIVGDGVTNTGYLKIANLPTNTLTLFPIGPTSYILPAYINPGANAGTAYTAYVFAGATMNAQSNGTPMSATTLSNMLNAIWNIGRTAGAGTATLQLVWAATAVPLQGAIFSGAGTSIGISQYTGAGGWLVETGSGNVGTRTATASFSSFTQFSITDNLFVLPVEVTDFNAILNNNNTVSVSWSASDAMEITGFDVQRSTDGFTFTTIGTVQANAAQSDYSLIDTHPVAGMNYYRLITHTTNGAPTYSPIRTVTLSDAASGIKIYPVPATTSVNVSLGNIGAGTWIRLISQTGRILQTTMTTANNQVVTMNISSYPAGAYFIEIISENKVLQSTTVTKL